MAKEIPGTHWTGEVGQKVIIMQDGQILLCRAYGFAKWDLPGGRLHKNEQPEEGLQREIREELGVEVEVGKPVDVAVTEETYSGIPRYFVMFDAKLVDPKAKLVLAPDEIEEVRWVSREEVDSLETWDHWKALLNEYFKTHA